MLRNILILWAALVPFRPCEATEADYHRPDQLLRGPMESKDHRELMPATWFVTFEDAEAVFDGLDDPEVAIKYTGPAPQTPNWYYRLQIMDPTCKQFQLNSPITPASPNGQVPDANFDAATSELTAHVNINTGTIKSSPVFYTAGANPQQFTITFCARMELISKGTLGDMAMAVENTILKFSVDMTKAFSFSNFQFSNEKVQTQLETVLVDYPLNIFYCDNNNNNVDASISDVLPGDPIQICVTTDSSSTGARVANLRSVQFQNDMDTGMAIPLVTAAGTNANEHTTLQCNMQGLCRIRTIAFARLYEKPEPNGSVVDISEHSKVVGTAVLTLTQRRRALAEGDVAVTGFQKEMDLATPPPPSSAPAMKIPGFIALLGMLVARA